MKRRGVVIGLLVLIGVALAAFAASKLAVLNKPGGQQIGTWYGPVEVLAVEGEWARVRMTGWVPKAQVAPAAPSGVRLDGSPDGGVWVSDVCVRKDFLRALRALDTDMDGRNLLAGDARELGRCIRTRDGAGVVSRFERIGGNTDFYPSGRILARGRVGRGSGERQPEPGFPGSAVSPAQRSISNRVVLPGASSTSKCFTDRVP